MWFLALYACADDPKGPGPTTETDSGSTEPCVAEIPYDGIDQDCDGDDLADVDGDGADASQAGGDDCDDDDRDVFPGAYDIAYDGIDQDCDDGDLVDVDGDGAIGMDAGGDDCDDVADDVFPGAPDPAGDSVDADCDGVDGVDADADSFADWRSGGTDCDDADDTRFPGATETWYDGVDQDCDRACDYDVDGDGAVLPGSPIVNGDRCDASPGPLVTAPQDCDDADAALIWIDLVERAPYPGQTGIFADAVVTARLSEVDPSATLTLTDDGGDLVAGVSAVDGDVVTFTPDALLAPLQRYDVTLTWRCDTSTWDFQTLSGRVDPSELAGVAWELDLASATWTEPPNLGPVVPLIFVTPSTLTVVAAGADTLDVRLAGGVPQDLCQTTEEVPGAPFDQNPRVWVEASAMPVGVYGADVYLSDITLDLEVSPDGAAGGTLTGELDTRSLVDYLTPGGADDAVCLLIAAFGVSCTPCADGAGQYCLDLRAEDLSGPPTAPFVEVTAADVANDPSCP